jgi:Lrp/AsnC family transcriptional regulator for asnA, asnC and gidA
MQIVAVTDPLQLGLHRQAMVLIKVEGDVREVAARLAEFDEVDYLVMTAGSVDLLAEVVVPDDAALLELLNERIRSVPGVVSTESVIYLQLVKQTYQWSLP